MEGEIVLGSIVDIAPGEEELTEPHLVQQGVVKKVFRQKSRKHLIGVYVEPDKKVINYDRSRISLSEDQSAAETEQRKRKRKHKHGRDSELDHLVDEYLGLRNKQEKESFLLALDEHLRDAVIHEISYRKLKRPRKEAEGTLINYEKYFDEIIRDYKIKGVEGPAATQMEKKEREYEELTRQVYGEPKMLNSSETDLSLDRAVASVLGLMTNKIRLYSNRELGEAIILFVQKKARIRMIAKLFGIPKSTLARHISQLKLNRKADPDRLPEIQERVRDYISKLKEVGGRKVVDNRKRAKFKKRRSEKVQTREIKELDFDFVLLQHQYKDLAVSAGEIMQEIEEKYREVTERIFGEAKDLGRSEDDLSLERAAAAALQMSSPKTRMYSNSELESALTLFIQKEASIKEILVLYGVPKSTLSRHIRDMKVNRERNMNRLPEIQERIRRYIAELKNVGAQPSKPLKEEKRHAGKIKRPDFEFVMLLHENKAIAEKVTTQMQRIESQYKSLTRKIFGEPKPLLSTDIEKSLDRAAASLVFIKKPKQRLYTNYELEEALTLYIMKKARLDDILRLYGIPKSSLQRHIKEVKLHRSKEANEVEVRSVVHKYVTEMKPVGGQKRLLPKPLSLSRRKMLPGKRKLDQNEKSSQYPLNLSTSMYTQGLPQQIV